MATSKKPNWTKPAIAAIFFFVFGWIAWAISEYRPTASGQKTWEWISGLSFVVFIGAIFYAFVRTKKRD